MGVQRICLESQMYHWLYLLVECKSQLCAISSSSVLFHINKHKQETENWVSILWESLSSSLFFRRFPRTKEFPPPHDHLSPESSSPSSFRPSFSYFEGQIYCLLLSTFVHPPTPSLLLGPFCPPPLGGGAKKSSLRGLHKNVMTMINFLFSFIYYVSIIYQKKKIINITKNINEVFYNTICISQ